MLTTDIETTRIRKRMNNLEEIDDSIIHTQTHKIDTTIDYLIDFFIEYSSDINIEQYNRGD
jgi:hypothetical protein